MVYQFHFIIKIYFQILKYVLNTKNNMADIKEIKKEEMSEIIDFYYFIQDYGHIFYDDPKMLDEPFNKISSGIKEIKEIVDNNHSR